ncbi:hypothetical protein NCLIV_015860 [Neospora caninum Liverpool]|uniref:Uncharacterized protein n=1 Tax=Neospora caninum (strain Liverpool) TaxID=572307 RepID=F0VDK1_NEOCL|nr:hypothetical protein NCLIV_015860 [Neospora caninum Liverpool]CBZ51794.1 hypothetical protein NCLIV_015860 [Neospora caninum Liverpool]CEL65753.1 TPA: hypothetical protein BN1204_015860 [Neospora caninum Liverpool]|eukprot:XP_003881827.1 hypothetical protein NCLIV_015860 [Neospora caninum Liverpool]
MALRLSTPLLIADRVRTSWTYRGGVRFSLPRFMITKRTYLSTKFRRPSTVTKWGNPQYTLPSKVQREKQENTEGDSDQTTSEESRGRGEQKEIGRSGKFAGKEKKATDTVAQEVHTPKYCDMLFLHQEDQKRRIRPHANFFFR